MAVSVCCNTEALDGVLWKCTGRTSCESFTIQSHAVHLKTLWWLIYFNPLVTELFNPLVTELQCILTLWWLPFGNSTTCTLYMYICTLYMYICTHCTCISMSQHIRTTLYTCTVAQYALNNTCTCRSTCIYSVMYMYMYVVGVASTCACISKIVYWVLTHFLIK